MFGLQAHLLHEPGSLNRLGEAGIVFDIGGDHELAALFEAGDEHRLEQRARGVDRRRIAGRAGADDDDARMLRHEVASRVTEPAI